MSATNQLSFGDGLHSNRRKISTLSKHLHQLDQIVDWQPLVAEFSVIDQTDPKTGGRPCKSLVWMIKATFSPANVHDSTQTKKLISYDEKALFGDKAYFNGDHKYSARYYGWYYGVLVKPARGQKLSASQKKRNRKLSRVRATVEHPFAWVKTKANLTAMRAKTQAQNRLRFIFACLGRNSSRAAFLLLKSKSVGSLLYEAAKEHKIDLFRSQTGRKCHPSIGLDGQKC